MSANAVRRMMFCALLATTCAQVNASEMPAIADGLAPVRLQGFDKAWQRPGTSLREYSSVLMKPVTVEFSKHWRPRDFGPFGLKTTEVERIRSTYAGIASDTLTHVLSKGGYSIATAPGARVLEVQARIVDLYVNAPEYDADVLTRTYVRNAGDMRLLVTLRDSVTGTALVEISDLKRGDEHGWLTWANSVYNRTEAERTLTGWGHQLLRVLKDEGAR